MTNFNTSEKGSGSALCMLLSIGIVIYLPEKWEIITGNLEYPIPYLILIVAGFFVFTSLIIGLYKVLSGEKTPRQLRKIIQREMKKLEKIINNTEDSIKIFSDKLKNTTKTMSPRGFEELNTLKALVNAINSRNKRVRSLLRRKDDDSISSAYNIMFDDVSVQGDALLGLITQNNDVRFSYDDIKKEFEKRLLVIEKHFPGSHIKENPSNLNLKLKKRARVATA